MKEKKNCYINIGATVCACATPKSVSIQRKKKNEMKNIFSPNSVIFACTLYGFTNSNKREKQRISQHLEFIYQTKVL